MLARISSSVFAPTGWRIVALGFMLCLASCLGESFGPAPAQAESLSGRGELRATVASSASTLAPLTSLSATRPASSSSSSAAPAKTAPPTAALLAPDDLWTPPLSGRGEVRGRVAAGRRAAPGVRAAGDVTGQHVVMNSGRVTNLHGAVVPVSGNVIGNSATLNGGEVVDEVGGGRTSNGDALNNSVIINGGSLRIIRGGISHAGEASGNSVTINTDIGAVPVYGGNSLNGAVRNNTIILNSGGAGDLWGGNTNSGAATGNRVVVHEGVVHHDVVGANTGNGEASGNHVEIKGGYFLGGGIYGAIIGGISGSGLANNNTVTISGSPDMQWMDIHGGRVGGGGVAVDVRSGNTLNINAFQGQVRNVENFQHINFLLPAHIKNRDMLLRGNVDMSAPAGQGATTVRITGMQAGGDRLHNGDTLRLMYGHLDTTGLNFSGGSFRQGLFMEYDYDLLEDVGAGGRSGLDARIIRADLTPEVEAPTDGPNADGGLINGGADLIAGAGMEQALAAARVALRPHEQTNPWGVGVFGVFSGGQTQYNIPSRLSLASTHYAVGATKLWDMGHSEVLAGGYVDLGLGNYKSQRKAAGRPAGGGGDSTYYGGGILARYARKTGMLAGTYVEATARMGLVESTYQSKDLQILAQREVKYRRSVPYYSAHAGVGHVISLTEHASLDVYGKVFWSRLDGSRQRIAGDEFTFMPLDSLRVRGGARVNYALGENVSLYAGAAYEQELDGRPKAKVHGTKVQGADMRGGTGIGELGVSFTLGDESNFSMDIGGQGFIGKREGIMGTVRAQYAF